MAGRNKTPKVTVTSLRTELAQAKESLALAEKLGGESYERGLKLEGKLDKATKHIQDMAEHLKHHHRADRRHMGMLFDLHMKKRRAERENKMLTAELDATYGRLQHAHECRDGWVRIAGLLGIAAFIGGVLGVMHIIALV